MPARTRRDSLDTSFHRAILRYTRSFADGSTVSATPFFGQDKSALDASFGAVPQQESNTSWKYGVRASYRVRLTQAITASIGMDALGSASSLTRAGSLTLPPREGDLYVFGQPPGADVNADAWTYNIVNVGPYVLAEVRLGPVILTPGLRADAFLIEGSRLTPRVGETPAVGFSRLVAAVDPRLSVSWAWTPRITVSASAGIYHAPPRPEDLSAVFGTPALSLSRAIHAAIGEAVRFDKGFSLELTGYYRDLDHLVVRTRLPTPKLGLALTQDGEGRSYGVSVLLRRQLQNGLYGWLSYAASRSKRRYRGDAAYRLFDFDQTHVISAVAGYERNGWGGGLRLRYATGMPRTPVVGAFYEATSGEFQPIFGDPNSARLPPFFSLDLRLEKKFDLGKTAVRLSLDVINVTMRKNPEEVIYSDDYEKRSYITGLPTLGVLGVRVER